MTRQTLLFALALLSASSLLAAEKKKPIKITYEEHVKPILRQKCFSCHNPDKKSGDLDVTNYTNLMQGGGSGTVIEAGDASGSYLYSLVNHDEEPYMPPESPKIADEMLETIRKWIDGGALENAGSKGPAISKPKFDLALQDAPTERPSIPPVPPRLSLEPIVHTSKTTAVASIATNPWSPVAAVAGQQQVLLYDTKTLRLLGRLPFPEGVPKVLKFSRNGSLLLAGGGRPGASGLCVVWNVKTGERVFEIGDELDVVLAADISSDQTLVALGGPRRVVRIYSTETGKLMHELRKHTDWIYSLEFSPDSVLLATGDRNGGLFVWEGWTGREYLMLKGHTAGVTDVSWRSDSNVVATSSEDGSIRLWEMENGSQVKNWRGHNGGTASVEFARDGRIVSCGRDKVTKLWKGDGAAIRSFPAFGDLALAASICDESNRVLAGDYTGEVRVFDATNGAQAGAISTNPLPLAQRLAAAQSQLTQQQAAHKPLADAYTTAQANLAKMQAAVVAAKTAVDVTEKESGAAKNMVALYTKAQADAKAAKDAAAAEVAQLNPLVPVLQEAATKSQAAAAKLPADKSLAEAAGKFKAAYDGHAAKLAAAGKKVTEQTTAMDAATKSLAAAQDATNKLATKLTTAKQQYATLMAQVKPASDAAAAAKTKADAAAGAVQTAQAAVDRWQGEIAFHASLEKLRQQREAARKELSAKQTELAAAQDALQKSMAGVQAAMAMLTAAQSQVTTAEQQQTAATAKLAAAKKSQDEATAAKSKAEVDLKRWEEAVASLQQAETLTTGAAAKLPGDAQVAAAAGQLKTTVAAKTGNLNTAKTTLTAAQQKLTTATAATAAAQSQVTSAQTAVAAAKEKASAASAALPPLQQKQTMLQAAADKASAAVQAAQAQVQASDNEIAAARGMK